MKRKPTSTIYHIARYLHDVQHLTTFTSHDLREHAVAARDYYESRIPASVFAEETAIIERHGFTKETWKQVLVASSSFYFCPTDEINACNREIRSLFLPYAFINMIPRQDNYLCAMISVAVRRRVFEYLETVNRLRVYRINPDYLGD